MSPDKIRTIRKSLGLSYRQFARLVGLNGQNSQDTVERWETGKRIPSEEMKAKIKEVAEPLLRYW